MMIKKTKHTSEDSTVLYGVPKVSYETYGCTPFPMCLKACANYLGRDLDYDYVMAASGAAFRLVWDTTSWNGGNVDVIFTYDDPVKIYQTGMNAIGCKYNLLGRTAKSKKEDFIQFIKEQIDSGFPCIALGIIGPPEACIITGYRDNGRTLLGWNFFQDYPENGSCVKTDESGYFITDKWWENTDTKAVMSTSQGSDETITFKNIVENAAAALEGRTNGKYAKGIYAYDAWKKAILNDSEFSESVIMPLLVEKLMCQGDAMDCLADGRKNASIFFSKAADHITEHSGQIKLLAEHFEEAAASAFKMADVLGGWERGEQQMRNLVNPRTRKQLAVLIDEAKNSDLKALEILKELSRLSFLN